MSKRLWAALTTLITFDIVAIATDSSLWSGTAVAMAIILWGIVVSDGRRKRS